MPPPGSSQPKQPPKSNGASPGGLHTFISRKHSFDASAIALPNVESTWCFALSSTDYTDFLNAVRPMRFVCCFGDCTDFHVWVYAAPYNVGVSPHIQLY